MKKIELYKIFLLIGSFITLLIYLPSFSLPKEYIDKNIYNYEIGYNINTHESKKDYTINEKEIIPIEFIKNQIDTKSNSYSFADNTLEIKREGTYMLSGTLEEGNISVNLEDKNEGVVKLVLNNLSITSSKGSTLSISNTTKTIIILQEDSENHLNYNGIEKNNDKQASAILSRDNLTLQGNGHLEINSLNGKGINSRDGLIITGGDIKIESTDVAIDGKDYVVIKDGIIDIVTLRHGIRSNNNTTPLMGSIFVENGGIKIISEKHSLSANTNVVIEGGQLDLTAGGGSYAHVNRNNTSKGIRSSMDIFINGGEITINSGADGIHAKNNIEINEGKISIKAGDDAITSLSTITVNNGDIDISDCYEGLEAGEIIINNGQIYIHSRDDGLNTVIKNKDVDLPLSIYGIKKLPTIDKTNIEINGGYIFINSQGDGIDANGPIIMHDGTLIIHGPDSFLESAVDYLDSFEILNGFLVAIGPKVLAQVPSSEHPDSQVSIHIIFNSVVTTGTLFSIQDEEKNSLITIKSLKPFESILFSSPELKINKRYPVLLGGEVEGRIKDTMFYNISKFTRIETRKNFQITEKLTTIDFNNN